MKNTQQSAENIAQHEMFETAQRRIKQKKRLFFHFIVFGLASIFMLVINKVLGYGEPYDWFLWVILFWGFFFLLHVIDVFITSRFLGKSWERKYRDRLVALQEKKMMKMQAKIEKEYAKMAEKVAKEEAQANEKNELPSKSGESSKENTSQNTLGTQDPKI